VRTVPVMKLAATSPTAPRCSAALAKPARAAVALDLAGAMTVDWPVYPRLRLICRGQSAGASRGSMWLGPKLIASSSLARKIKLLAGNSKLVAAAPGTSSWQFWRGRQQPDRN
jgi:hypothetical protein